MDTRSSNVGFLDLSLNELIAKRIMERWAAKNNQPILHASLNVKREATQPPFPAPDLNTAFLNDVKIEDTDEFAEREQSTGTVNQEPLAIPNNAKESSTMNAGEIKKATTSSARIISTISSNAEIGVGKDSCKSLDQIIIERSIIKPRRFNSNKRDNDIPTTTETASQNRDTNRKPVSSISLRKDIDPLSSTLDELIETPLPKLDKKKTPRSTVVGGVKRKYDNLSLASNYEGDLTFGNFLARPDIGIKMPKWPKGLTPYTAIGYLCEHGMMIEYMIGKQFDEAHGVDDHLWQCKVTCGYISGRAESSRKVVAREVASREFLQALRAEYPEVEIPRFEVPDGVFIDPKVKQLAANIAKEYGIRLRSETTVQKTDPRKRNRDDPEYVYVCTYFVGDEEIRGIHPNLNYATLEAAKMLWEMLSQKSYRFTKFSVGDSCSPEFKYNFFETEVYNSLDLNHGMDDDTDGDDDFLNEGFLAAVTSKEAVHESLKRRKLADAHKQRKKDEHERRRNMEIDLNPPTPKSGPSVSPKRRVSVYNVDEEVACSSAKTGIERGIGRGRGIRRGEQSCSSSSSSIY